MSWATGIVVPLFLLVVGYLVGIAKDRSNTIYARKMEVLTKLHEYVLEIEQNDLSVKGSHLVAIRVNPMTRDRSKWDADDEKINNINKMVEWREKMRDQERRARLWLSAKTVNLVGDYFILMMYCKSWESLGSGNLIEDDTFLDYVRRIFGKEETITNNDNIVKRNSTDEAPWLLDCDYLSNECLTAIQKRMNVEMSTYPYLKACWQKLFPFSF